MAQGWMVLVGSGETGADIGKHKTKRLSQKEKLVGHVDAGGLNRISSDFLGGSNGRTLRMPETGSCYHSRRVR